MRFGFVNDDDDYYYYYTSKMDENGVWENPAIKQ